MLFHFRSRPALTSLREEKTACFVCAYTYWVHRRPTLYRFRKVLVQRLKADFWKRFPELALLPDSSTSISGVFY